MKDGFRSAVLVAISIILSTNAFAGDIPNADGVPVVSDGPSGKCDMKAQDATKAEGAQKSDEGTSAKAKLDVEASQDLASKYVWRGINLVNAPVYQPSMSLELMGFRLSLWGNCELTNWNGPNYPRPPACRFTEYDFTTQYSGKLGHAGWSLGIIDYQFPGTGSKSYQEWFGSASFDDAWGSPSLTLYKGDNRFSGAYATLALSRSVPAFLGKSQAIDLGVELSYGDAQCNKFLYGHDAASLTDVHLHAGAEFALGRHWTISPSLHFSSLLQSGLLEGSPRRTNVWLNLNVGTSF